MIIESRYPQPYMENNAGACLVFLTNAPVRHMFPTPTPSLESVSGEACAVGTRAGLQPKAFARVVTDVRWPTVNRMPARRVSTSIHVEEMMNPVVHFEMPYDDRTRMAKFYESAFGWQMQMLGDDLGNYVVATTTETGADGSKTPGAINGGFFPKKPDWPAQYPSVVIAVDDINQSISDVTDAGGKVLGEPMQIPGVGQYISFIDTEGNRVSMLQPLSRDRHKAGA